MKGLTIREATVDDIPAIVQVRHAAFTEEEVCGFTPPEHGIFYSSKDLKKAWGTDDRLKDGRKIAVAQKADEIVGFAVFTVKKDCGYIDNITIAKGEQRRGAGKALVLHIEGLAKAAGISVMKTDTTENAAGVPWKSYGFWTKMGYRDTSERRTTEYDFKEIPFIKNLK